MNKKESTLQIRLDKQTHKELKKYAIDKDTSMSKLMKAAIDKILKN